MCTRSPRAGPSVGKIHVIWSRGAQADVSNLQWRGHGRALAKVDEMPSQSPPSSILIPRKIRSRVFSAGTSPCSLSDPLLEQCFVPWWHARHVEGAAVFLQGGGWSGHHHHLLPSHERPSPHAYVQGLRGGAMGAIFFARRALESPAPSLPLTRSDQGHVQQCPSRPGGCQRQGHRHHRRQRYDV